MMEFIVDHLALQEDAVILAMAVETLLTYVIEPVAASLSMDWLYFLIMVVVARVLAPVALGLLTPHSYASSRCASRYTTYALQLIIPLDLIRWAFLYYWLFYDMLYGEGWTITTIASYLGPGNWYFITVLHVILYEWFFPQGPRQTPGSSHSSIDPPLRHGGDVVAHVLQQHGVQYVFTLIGGHISPILVGCERYRIRVIDVRHEATAVFAADAVSRLSPQGQVGVACVTAGPGVTNTVTAVQNACMAQSPLVLLGGATLGLLRGKGSLQDMDHMRVLHSMVKWQTRVTRVCDIVPALEQAFAVATSGVPGPVFVELPLDVLYPQDVIRSQVLIKFKGKTGLVNTMAQWYLQYYLRRLYGPQGSLKVIAPSVPKPIPTRTASETQLDQVVHILITQARRPLILMGPQASRPTPAHDNNNVSVQDVILALRSLQIPVYLTGGARGLLGRDDEIHIRHGRSNAIKQADVILLLGVACDFRLNYGFVFRSKTTLIAINLDRKHLTWNKRPHVSLHASVPHALVRLAQKMGDVQQQNLRQDEWNAFRHQLLADDAKRDAEIQQQAQVQLPAVLVNDNRQPILADHDVDHSSGGRSQNQIEIAVCNPLAVCLAVNQTLPRGERDNNHHVKCDSGSIVVCDGGDFIGTAAYTVRPHGPLQWLDPGPFGTLGVGAGFALGAKLVRPDATVVLLWGDGSAAYSLVELDTMVRHNLPVVCLIGNDACWTQIHRDQQQLLKSPVGCMLAFSKYHEVAQALGGKGYLVTQSNELEGILAQAYQDVQNKPVVVNVTIGKTQFRDGSISV